MSDKTIKQEMVTYDFTKNIVGIEINPSFIVGLQTIASKFMLDASEEDQVKIPDAMKKFELIMAYDPKGADPMPQLQLDPFEQNLYVLFGLINYLRYEAEKQGLAIKGEVEVNEDLMKAAEWYMTEFDNLTFLAGDGGIDSDSAYWGGSFYSELGEQTSKPNGVRIYGTWTATHTVSGATVNNKWYAVVSFNEDGKVVMFSDWMDVTGMQTQIDAHIAAQE